MNFDIEGHAGAVERTVSSLERDGRPAQGPRLRTAMACDLDRKGQCPG